MKLFLKAHTKIAEQLMVKSPSLLDASLLAEIRNHLKSFNDFRDVFYKLMHNPEIYVYFTDFLIELHRLKEDKSVSRYTEPLDNTSILNSVKYFDIFAKKVEFKKIILENAPEDYKQYRKCWDDIICLRYEIIDLLKINRVYRKAYDYFLYNRGRAIQRETMENYLKFLSLDRASWGSWFDAMYAFESFFIKEDEFLRKLV